MRRKTVKTGRKKARKKKIIKVVDKNKKGNIGPKKCEKRIKKNKIG